MIHRTAVRGLLLADPAAVLLTMIHLPDRDTAIWLAPGGGLEPGESPTEALVREILEETGHKPTNWSGPVWQRRHRFEFQGEIYDQQEAFYLIQTPRFDPDHRGNPAAVEQSLFQAFRWWTLEEIRASAEVFVPADMAIHLEQLLRDGCPDTPVDVGI